MPQQNLSRHVEPLIFERQTVTVDGREIVTVLFDARYDYSAKCFRGYALVGEHVTQAEIALPPDQAALAVSSWIHGWLFPAQRTKLYHLALSVPKGQIIVEIGSWKGKSTAILGWGSKAGNRVEVWAIDPHEATPQYWILHNGGVSDSTWAQFSANMTAGGLDDVVFPLTVPSQAAARLIRQPIGLLFLDGDHHYAALDVALWIDKIAPGGWIVLHDTNYPTVQAGLVLLAESGQFSAPEMIDNMAICQRKVDG